ncbi:MAG: hypothetical protein V4525_10845 [Pseudomonadota bacterium]
MEDFEIYNIAVEIIHSINQDINEAIYEGVNGSLSLVWSDQKLFNAWAESCEDFTKPPKHKIGLHYELARQIYRDAENYCNFAENELPKEKFQNLFTILQPAPTLPAALSKDDCCYIMFVGALTWVYFHELGHLTQEHGYIRKIFSTNTSMAIHECLANSPNKLDEKNSILSHVMEIAADFEAITFCIFELSRHFEGEKLQGAIYMFICGISCIFHRFNEEKLLPSEAQPTGSHPNPIIRMEFNLPHIYELLDIFQKPFKLHLDRKGIVHLYYRAAHSSSLFWLWQNTEIQDIPNYYFLEGILNRPDLKPYFRSIISTWDEIEPTITKIRRFGNDFGLIQFTEELREKLM